MSLITIDQLLESVDLDFEPRWVTKDENGIISIWGSKPKLYRRQRYWASSEFNTAMESFGFLKLTEFANKDWTECIYEVPRKVDYTKWIGKVCKFYDSDNARVSYGILTQIFKSGYKCNGTTFYFKHCEPVRPDDDVIYKGE